MCLSPGVIAQKLAGLKEIDLSEFTDALSNHHPGMVSKARTVDEAYQEYLTTNDIHTEHAALVKMVELSRKEYSHH